jgi:hypothetical protein
MRFLKNLIFFVSFLICSCTDHKENIELSSTKNVKPYSQIYLGIKLGGLVEDYNETLISLTKSGRLSVLDNGVAYELNEYKNQKYILVPSTVTYNGHIDEVQLLVASKKEDIGVLVQDFKKNNYNMNIPLNKKDKIRSGILEKLNTMYGLPESTDTTKSGNNVFGEMISINRIWRTTKEQILFTETYFAPEQGLEESFSSMYITFKINSL